MSSSDKNRTFKPNVAQPIKIIERTVNPEVFRRKKQIRAEEILPDLAHRFGKTTIDEWKDFTNKMNIVIFGTVHGLVMGITYMLFYLNYLPLGDQGLKMLAFLLISLPLGLYLSDLYQAVSVAIISMSLWVILTTTLISFPNIIGAVSGSGIDAMITNVPQLFEFIIFLPLAIVSGLIVQSLISDLRK